MPDPKLLPAEKQSLITKYRADTVAPVFGNLANDPLALKGLLIYSVRERSHENVLFVLAVRGCKMLPMTDRHEKLARHIYTQFILEDAPNSINITGAIRGQITAAATPKAVQVRVGGVLRSVQSEALRASTFDAAFKDIDKLSRDTGPRFGKWLTVSKNTASTLTSEGSEAPDAVRECQAELQRLASFGVSSPV